MARPKRRALYHVSPLHDLGVCWQKHHRTWVRWCEGDPAWAYYSFASFRTAKQAWKYADLCPADYVLVERFQKPRDRNARVKTWIVGPPKT